MDKEKFMKEFEDKNYDETFMYCLERNEKELWAEYAWSLGWLNFSYCLKLFTFAQNHPDLTKEEISFLVEMATNC